MESAICGSVPDGTLLIETFAVLPGQNVARAALHLARMTRSAKALGFSFDEGKARALLSALDAPTPLRARLTLAQDGMLDLTTAQMPAPLSVWRFAIHDIRLSSDDPYLHHKTTQRALYNDTRAALPDGMDEWVFLNERGEVCEGTITNIAITTPEGEQLTPPTSAGCLPGVFRQSLIDAGRLHEATLMVDDLRHAAKITLMNALRGANHAVWVQELPA